MKYFLTSLTLCATPVLADLNVTFIEGAPKDRFDLTFQSSCPLDAMQVTIDLTGSAGALIFDTSSRGAGVEVFQPFQLVQGQHLVATAPQVVDGDRKITLNLSPIETGQTVSFTIDVDDTVSNRQITVNDSEIAGARVWISGTSAAFGTDATATIKLPECMG